LILMLYRAELVAPEKLLLEFEPMRRIVPITSNRMMASITAYSTTSCPLSADQKGWRKYFMIYPAGQ